MRSIVKSLGLMEYRAKRRNWIYLIFFFHADVWGSWWGAGQLLGPRVKPQRHRGHKELKTMLKATLSQPLTSHIES